MGLDFDTSAPEGWAPIGQEPPPKYQERPKDPPKDPRNDRDIWYYLNWDQQNIDTCMECMECCGSIADMFN